MGSTPNIKNFTRNQGTSFLVIGIEFKKFLCNSQRKFFTSASKLSNFMCQPHNYDLKSLTRSLFNKQVKAKCIKNWNVDLDWSKVSLDFVTWSGLIVIREPTNDETMIAPLPQVLAQRTHKQWNNDSFVTLCRLQSWASTLFPKCDPIAMSSPLPCIGLACPSIWIPHYN